MTKKKSQGFLYKKGYNYIEHWAHDCEFLSNKFIAVNEIGNKLINEINFTNNPDNIWHLNSDLSYLSHLLLAHIEIFCGKWNELFHKTFNLEFDNNNPFLFVNNIFILNKHIEREINDFYHGYFNIINNIDKKKAEKMQKLFNNMKNENIYNVMRALKKYSKLSREAYLNKCKETNGKNWALKDFEGISNEEFLDKEQVFLPQFDSYINVIFQINESYFLKNGDSKKKRDRHQEIVKYTKKILEEFIKKFTIKKFFKLFIAQEWNKYINGLQNLMYFFNVFMYINLQENDINNLSFFKNTNWYEQYNADKDNWIKKSNKYKLQKLKKINQNCKSSIYNIYSMSIKYKIEDAKKNKNLINDEIKLSKIKSKGGPGNGGRKPGSKNRMTLDKLSDKVDNLTDNLNKLAKIVTDGFASVNHRIDRIVKVNRLNE